MVHVIAHRNDINLVTVSEAVDFHQIFTSVNIPMFSHGNLQIYTRTSVIPVYTCSYTELLHDCMRIDTCHTPQCSELFVYLPVPLKCLCRKAGRE